MRVLVCQANFFDSVVDRIRQRRKEPLNQQHRVVQKHTAILSPKKPAKKNIKRIKPTERFTSNDNKIAKSTNDYRDERHPLIFRPQFNEKQIIATGLLPEKNPINSETIA